MNIRIGDIVRFISEKMEGKVTGIISNIVIVKTEGPVAQNEIATVKLGEVRMMAEVIKVVGDDAYIQVFDSTRGLRMGAEVEFEGHMLEATLGPGILSKNYDGLQNDLADMDGLFIRRGQRTSPLNEETLWEFRPLAKPGDRVEAGDWLGEVKEQWIMHKIMVPFAFEGSYTVRSVAGAGEYNINHTVAVLEDAQGGEHPVTMVQKWPVKRPIKAYVSKPRPSRILETGVRPIDTFNPIADGGTGFIPGPFGAGKTVLQHAIAKQAEADLLFLPIYYEPASLILTQADSMGYEPKFFGVDGMDGILTMEGFDPSLAEGLMLLTPFSATVPETQSFVEAYTAANDGVTPNQFAADAYDGVYIVKEALEKAGCTADMSSADICEALVAQMTQISYSGLTGTDMTWNAEGQVSKAPTAYVIKGGEYVLPEA